MTDEPLHYIDLDAYCPDELPEQCGRHGVGFRVVGEYHVDTYRYVGTLKQLVEFLDDAYDGTEWLDECLTTHEVVLRYGKRLVEVSSG